jgi:PhoPQ-activated pathogenicity-related protein
MCKIDYMIICVTYLFRKSLGGWSFALNDSYVENLTRYLDNPYFQVIADIVDPYCIALFCIVLK